MFLAVRALCRMSGFHRCRALGKLMGEIEFRVASRTRERCARDMAFALGCPGGAAEVMPQLRRAYHTGSWVMLEVLAMLDRRLDDGALAACCEIEGEERLHSALARGRGAILLGTHMGNGVAFAARLARAGVPISVVYRQARMMSDEFFQQGLALYGAQGIRANDGKRAYIGMLRALKSGRVVFMTMDQGVKNPRDGIEMRFLGKDMPMPAGPAPLARRSSTPILPVATTGSDPSWRFEIGPPLPEPPSDASLESDVERLVRLTERQILHRPELWDWHHRRWLKYPPASALRVLPHRA